MKDDRRAAAQRAERGARGERLAAGFFEEAGYVVWGRNVRVGRLEVDLVVRDGAVIAVVEVRVRGPGAWVGPLASVDPKKQLRIRRAGELLWQRVFKKDASLERMRFDILAVSLDDVVPAFEHVRAAF
ncbi:MAG: YraN family protein [Polyangiaceae bacterium]